MDLHLVFAFLPLSLLILTLFCLEAQGVGHSTSSGEEFNVKDITEDMKPRRKSRVEIISLKPPPQDWPEPEMAAGDFIIIGTTTSPLVAYQAKLQQEYLQQKQVNLQEKKREKSEETTSKSEITSSEEVLHQLLDPDELLKHNKQLRSFMTVGKNLKLTSRQTVPHPTQSKEAKPVSNILKTSKSPIKKTKSENSKKTSLKPKRRRKKTDQKAESNSQSSQDKSKFKVRKLNKISPSLLTTRKIRKRVRKFTFAEQKYNSSLDKESSLDILKRSSEEITPNEKDTTTVVQSVHTVERTIKGDEERTTVCTPVKSAATKGAQTVYTPTLGVTAQTFEHTNNATYTSTTAQELSHSTRSVTKFSIRQKRKKVKKEMEKVLQEEKLEGSFGDSDSQWTTSEEMFYVEYNEMEKDFKKKIEVLRKSRTTTPKPLNATTKHFIIQQPTQNMNQSKGTALHLVTPRQALVGIMRQKVIGFIDKILKKKPN